MPAAENNPDEKVVGGEKKQPSHGELSRTPKALANAIIALPEVAKCTVNF